MNPVLNSFFVVTKQRDVWGVRNELYSHGKHGVSEPVVEKIACGIMPNTSPVGTRLAGGTHVVVSWLAVGLFSPHFGLQDPGLVPNQWGGTTGPVTVLFLREQDARAGAESREPLLCDDPRWHAETSAVLKRIGETHPVFRIAKPPLRLASYFPLVA